VKECAEVVDEVIAFMLQRVSSLEYWDEEVDASRFIDVSPLFLSLWCL
jgi:hypothetical protein